MKHEIGGEVRIILMPRALRARMLRDNYPGPRYMCVGTVFVGEAETGFTVAGSPTPTLAAHAWTEQAKLITSDPEWCDRLVRCWNTAGRWAREAIEKARSPQLPN